MAWNSVVRLQQLVTLTNVLNEISEVIDDFKRFVSLVCIQAGVIFIVLLS